MMTTVDLSTLERATKRILKCTLCNKNDCLLKLGEELQQYSRKKGFESYFCTTTLQVVNFVKK